MLHVVQESVFGMFTAQARQKTNVLAPGLTPKKSATHWIPVHGGLASGQLATQRAVLVLTLERSHAVKIRIVTCLMLRAVHGLATAKPLRLVLWPVEAMQQ